MSLAQYPWNASPQPVQPSIFLTTGDIQTCTSQRAARVHRSRNTHRRKAHSLDIVQLVYDPIERPATVSPIAGIAGICGGAVGEGEAVSEKLVDGSGAPFSRGSGTGDGREEEDEQ